MARFTILLDKRNPSNKKGEYNLAIRACIGRDVVYLNIAKMTERQYNIVFERNSIDEVSIKYREECEKLKTKCERIINELRPYDKRRFRELFYEKEKAQPTSLALTGLFDYFVENCDLKLRTKTHIKMTKRALENYQPGLTVLDITPEFLKRFEMDKLNAGMSQATIDSYNRDLRRVINYFSNEKKMIPKTYSYPFGKGGYSIKSFFPKKLVMTNDEIKSVVDFKDFENPGQEYSRDVWLLLYRCNGINFVDLLRMRWTDIKGDYIIFFRKKTETTRKNNKKEITVPVTDKLRELIDKIGVKDSPFILGKLQEGYQENTFENRCHKISQKINQDLAFIAGKLGLSVPLKLKTARDAYATTLLRGGISKDEIGSMLGHSNSVVTEHYLASLDIEKTHQINSVLF